MVRFTDDTVCFPCHLIFPECTLVLQLNNSDLDDAVQTVLVFHRKLTEPTDKKVRGFNNRMIKAT